MSWLKHAEVRQDSEAKVEKLTERINSRRETASGDYEHAQVYSVVKKSLADGLALKREWFFSSIGIEWIDGERETVYLSRAPISATFTDENLVHWTHWVGRAYTRLKEALQDGQFPQQIIYGPAGRETPHETGPLVQYQFVDGQLRTFEFRFIDQIFEEAAALQVPALAPVEVKPPHYGLKDIVQLRDITQDDQIRGSLAGVYMLLGGPGTGKTTVALHRIPYLILEQKELLPLELPAFRGTFFSADTIHVVVWKQHLVPYLKDCLVELHFGDVAVEHIDDWVGNRLRAYVRLGREKDEHQIKDEPEAYERMKLGYVNEARQREGGVSEKLLLDFLTTRNEEGTFYYDMAEEALDRFQKLVADLQELTTPFRISTRNPLGAFTFTCAGIENAVGSIRSELDLVMNEIRDRQRSAKDEERRSLNQFTNEIGKSRDRLSNLRDSELERIERNYAHILFLFYSSKLVQKEIEQVWGRDGWERLLKHMEKRAERRLLSMADRYLLLWLIHYMTRGTEITRAGVQPLPLYSHTVIDEAQYYHPLVLRLLIQLAEPPLTSMTIVGDLEQKVSPEGLASWDELGVPKSQFHLETNYRWSRQVYQFLEKFRRQAHLKVGLRPPRNWVSGDGIQPEIVACADEDAEIDWLIRRMTDLRRSDQSMAVVVPPSVDEDWRNKVIEELRACDIPARSAEGQDVRACVEQIILTSYESIVGLEFDAVFLPRCEEVLTSPNADLDARQSAWVALTRAKRYIGVSHVGRISILDHVSFAPHHRSHRAP